MQTNTILKFLSAALVSVLLSACGGGGNGTAVPNDSSLTKSSGSNNSTTDQTSAAASSADLTSPQKIGNGSGLNFVEGQIGVESGSSAIPANGTTILTITAVNSLNELAVKSLALTFTSTCLTEGKATLSGGTSTINGTATAIYTAKGCVGSDVITASTVINNTVINAQTTVTVLSDSTVFSNIGFGSGDNFLAQQIGVSANSLSAGGVTTLTVNLVSAAGALVTNNLTVTFNSPCVAANKALLSNSSVTTSNGEASITYTANGCVGSDVVTASVQGKNVSAQATLTIQADTIGSVKFIDATPTQISLKGTGGSETSVVRFQVLGGTGAPIGDTQVDFSLSTTSGGLSLTIPQGASTPTVRTNSAGYASITVNAGSVSTSVRVTATTSTGLSTQSSMLTVSTGIPDQNSMSLSLTNLAPISWEYDGIESTATIRMADAFNNPVPDGSAVSFTTSGGVIDPSCITTAGACSVKWRSSQPRPTSLPSNHFTVDSDLKIHCPNELIDFAECRSGRVKILATAIGNESFVDKNGNGLYDPNIDLFTAPTDNRCYPNVPLSSASIGSATSCDDLGEAYIDKNFNGRKDPEKTAAQAPDQNVIEELTDYNVNSIFNEGDGIYNGVLCNSSNTSLCDKTSVTVRQDIALVMASTSVYTESGRLPGQPNGQVSIAAGSSISIDMLLADINGNGMPMGTTIKVSTDTASNITAKASPSFALGMSREPTIMSLFLKAGDDATKKPSGTVVVEISAPSILGNVTTTVSISVCGPATTEARDPNTNAIITPTTISNCAM
jgi:hypothetical protein